jgi:hypothetical protein
MPLDPDPSTIEAALQRMILRFSAFVQASVRLIWLGEVYTA